MASRAKPIKPYVVLLRGINVGGKNKLPMARLRAFLEERGYSDVSTYIASGNVILKSDRSPAAIQADIEASLPAAFRLDSKLIKVLVLTRDQLKAMIDRRPRGFGEQPGQFHSDAVFLMDIAAADAMRAFSPREGVDRVWPGEGVIYSQRLSAQRTRSHLNRITAAPAYKSMTIRNWSTTTALLELLRALSD
jgi:uncharacterized protein (DUF1697 family)